ncbi:uncharacterized protein LOC128206455 [Mya arenaria]|nr:uncharacterized protein LOC128206455 [Mya arenaria]
MPQEFQVVQCYSCSTFQVHQVKKALKWACKMCGEKQSIKKVFGRGTGAECRQHVQKLNTRRGDLDTIKQTVTLASDVDLLDDNTAETATEMQYVPTEIGKWSQFVDAQQDGDNNSSSDDDDEGLTTSSLANARGRKRKGWAKTEERQFTKYGKNGAGSKENDSKYPIFSTNQDASKPRSVIGQPASDCDSSQLVRVPDSKPYFSKPGSSNSYNLMKGQNSKWSSFSTGNTCTNVEHKRNNCTTPDLPSEESESRNDSLIQMNESSKRRSIWPVNDATYESSSQESSSSSSKGDNNFINSKGSNFINPNAPFPDPRPYVSFDDLEQCDKDIETCVSLGDAGTIFDEPKKHLRGATNVSKWNAFTSTSMATRSYNMITENNISGTNSNSSHSNKKLGHISDNEENEEKVDCGFGRTTSDSVPCSSKWGGFIGGRGNTSGFKAIGDKEDSERSLQDMNSKHTNNKHTVSSKCVAYSNESRAQTLQTSVSEKEVYDGLNRCMKQSVHGDDNESGTSNGEYLVNKQTTEKGDADSNIGDKKMSGKNHYRSPPKRTSLFDAGELNDEDLSL